MALTINVTKKSVTLQMPKLYNITLNLTCLDEQQEVLNKDFSVRYRTGDNIDDKASKFLKMMQYEINKYLEEQNIFNHTKMDNLVTYLGGNLVG